MSVNFRINRRPLASGWLIVLSAAFMGLFCNYAFYRAFVGVYGQDPAGLIHMFSAGLLLVSALVIFLSLVCWPRIQKPVLSVLFLTAAMAAYFMDTYNVVLDSEMFANAMATDPREVNDLVSMRMLAYLLLLGILPSALVWLTTLKRETALRAIVTRGTLVTGSILLILGLALSSSAFYSSYFRENKTLRYFSNPLTPIYSMYKTVEPAKTMAHREFQQIGLDAEVPESDQSHELVVMVVGETARADRFSLNGYGRETNPELAQLDVISFSNVVSCGTSTLVSLPCMFSLQDHAEFDRGESEFSENALDVLSHAGVTVLWRDNNSSSKGVAVRVPQEDYRDEEVNPVCDPECRDVGMLEGLQEYLDQHSGEDVLIVLHQIGSHGPAYSSRYPKSFERFSPVCDSAMLDECERAEIENSYDNSIAYTDYFLARVIDFLRENDEHYESVMFYVSDHGESLGEKGVYLHGYPYAFAPDEQIRVPVIMWFGEHYDDADPSAIRALSSQSLSHDNVFHTLLGLFEVESNSYNPQQDILSMSRQLDLRVDSEARHSQSGGQSAP